MPAGKVKDVECVTIEGERVNSQPEGFRIS